MTYDFNLSFGLKGNYIKQFPELDEYLHTDQVEITIAVPNMNRRHYLQEVVDCIVDQDYSKENYEVVIIDDASDDGSQDLMREICSKTDLKMRCIFLDHTRTWSPCHPWNVCMKEARGLIMLFLQPDLVFAQRHYLEAVWRHHNTYPNLYLSSVRHDFAVEDDPKAEEFINAKQYSKILDFCQPFRIDEYMIKTWGFYWPTADGASVRKEWLMKVAGFNEDIIREPCEVDLFNRIQRVGVTFGVDKMLAVIHRPHKIGRWWRTPPRVGGGQWNPPDPVTNKGREWGALTPEEREKIVVSPVF